MGATQFQSLKLIVQFIRMIERPFSQQLNTEKRMALG
jgi:hypothetical protein